VNFRVTAPAQAQTFFQLLFYFLPTDGASHKPANPSVLRLFIKVVKIQAADVF